MDGGVRGSLVGAGGDGVEERVLHSEVVGGDRVSSAPAHHVAEGIVATVFASCADEGDDVGMESGDLGIVEGKDGTAPNRRSEGLPHDGLCKSQSTEGEGSDALGVSES